MKQRTIKLVFVMAVIALLALGAYTLALPNAIPAFFSSESIDQSFDGAYEIGPTTGPDITPDGPTYYSQKITAGKNGEVTKVTIGIGQINCVGNAYLIIRNQNTTKQVNSGSVDCKDLRPRNNNFTVSGFDQSDGDSIIITPRLNGSGAYQYAVIRQDIYPKGEYGAISAWDAPTTTYVRG